MGLSGTEIFFVYFKSYTKTLNILNFFDKIFLLKMNKQLKHLKLFYVIRLQLDESSIEMVKTRSYLLISYLIRNFKVLGMGLGWDWDGTGIENFSSSHH